MTLHLLELLPELIEHICSYCSVTDLLNISCCNKEHYTFFRSFLWRLVELPWFIGSNTLLHASRHGFEFTRSLTFRYNNDFDNRLIEQSDNRTVEPPAERWQRVSNFYKSILESCNMERLTTLRTEVIFSDEGLHFTSELLQNLGKLSLYKCNDVTECGWRAIGAFPHLKHLELVDCSVHDGDVEDIVKKLTLQKLVVNQCRELSSICLQYIRNCDSIHTLSFSCWRFKDAEAGFTALSSMKSLQVLSITGYYTATNHAITLLNSLTSLYELDLSCCSNLDDSGLSKLSLMPRLKTLTISDCGKVTDEGFTALTVLSSLRKLNISGCWKLTDCGLTNMTILDKLEDVNIGGCRFITDVGMSALTHMKHLRKLNISGCCYVTDIGISFISNLATLRELFIGGCHVTDLGISQLVSLTLLRTLNISECNKVTDFGVSQISKIKPLRSLNIHGCKEVTYIGLSHLTRLSLDELNLKDCQLTDEVVRHFCNVSGMKELFGADTCVHSRILTRNKRLWLKQLRQKDRHIEKDQLKGYTKLTC